MLFSNNFSDFSLPEVHRDIFSLRNDVMHFHNVTYETYRKALILFKKINTELDVQLDKGIVLENKSENVELISLQYFNAIEVAIKKQPSRTITKLDFCFSIAIFIEIWYIMTYTDNYLWGRE